MDNLNEFDEVFEEEDYENDGDEIAEATEDVETRVENIAPVTGSGEMYGSVHTHFEDMFDTANNLEDMVLKFAEKGAKKVTLTGHGSMFAYEDLKAVVKSLKEKGLISADFEIIPGVEVYFGENGAHMTMGAKNYEGYKQICQVITESAKNSRVAKGREEFAVPITTIENLEKHIKGGNVYATSACVGGVFGLNMGLVEHNLAEDVCKAEEKLAQFVPEGFSSFSEAKALIEEWDAKKNDPSLKKPTKAEVTKAQRLAANGDDSVINMLTERADNARLYDEYKAENKERVAKAKKALEKASKLEEKLNEAKNALEEYRLTKGEREAQNEALYRRLEVIFGKENFYFEIQNHGLDSEKTVFNNVVKFAKKVGNPHFIASNDVHIGDYKGSDTWETSVKKREVERFMRFNSIMPTRGDEEEYGIKTDAELKDALLKIIEGDDAEKIIDSAISNIKTALEPCHVEFPEISIDGVNHYPKFSDNEAELFKSEVEKGLAGIFPDGVPEEYRKRVDYEIGIIEKMGYCGYHLIVKDYLQYGRLLGYLRTQEEIDNAPLTIEELEKYIDDNHIPRVGKGIGPGRGSAAGSVVCWALGIVDADPIKYGLLFERFLNPSRQSMPDIDSDFKEDIRDKVYKYIETRYGAECVSKVCTKSYAYGKAACGIANRYLAEVHAEEAMRGAPADPEKPFDMPGYLYTEEIKSKGTKTAVKLEIKKEYVAANNKASKDIDAAIAKFGLNKTKPKDGEKAVRKILEDTSDSFHLTDKEREIMELSLKISGLPNTLSMHACACIISGEPLSQVIPLAWNEANQKMTTQCLYPQAEDLGLLKMDLLGLKNLGVITRVMQTLEEQGRGTEDLLRTKEGVDKMLDDPAIYRDIFSTGRTKGVFQFESDGMAKMLKDFKPRCFDDIVILVAAYRPGPMDFIPEIIDSKWHKEDPENHKAPERSIKINHPVLDAILAPTYGVPIYQEQVMKIFQDLAGYDLAGADNVRRFMSKKKTDKLEHERDFFIYGSEYVKNKLEEELATAKAEGNAPKITELTGQIEKLPMHIKGCVGNGICTAEEANDFFNQLIEFSKYAFNKSHALCYALVAMYTAYQKEYFPELFYQQSLSNESRGGGDNPVPKYAGEMRDFGLEILPPELGKSRADFEIEGQNIRMGYGNVKGLSYEDYKIGRPTVVSFLTSNPGVNVATAITLAKLGLFKGIWNEKSDTDQEAEYKRCEDISPAYMATFIKDYAPMIKEMASLMALSKDLSKNPEENAEEIAKAQKKISEIRTTLKGEKDIQHLRKTPKISEEERLEKRSFEIEKYGQCFSYEAELNKLRKYSGRYCDNNIKEFLEDSSSFVTHSIPVVVLSKKEGKNGRYDYELCDKNGEHIRASSFDELPDYSTALFGLKTKTSKNGNIYINITYAKPLAGTDYEKRSDEIEASESGGEMLDVCDGAER